MGRRRRALRKWFADLGLCLYVCSLTGNRNLPLISKAGDNNVPLDDDYAVYIAAKILGKPENITSLLLARAQHSPFTLFNNQTNFMEARNSDGSLAGPDAGWTEGSYSSPVDTPEIWCSTDFNPTKR